MAVPQDLTTCSLFKLETSEKIEPCPEDELILPLHYNLEVKQPCEGKEKGKDKGKEKEKEEKEASQQQILTQEQENVIDLILKLINPVTAESAEKFLKKYDPFFVFCSLIIIGYRKKNQSLSRSRLHCCMYTICSNTTNSARLRENLFTSSFPIFP